MRNALVVSESEQSINAIKKILGDEGYTAVASASNYSEVKELTENMSFDLIFVNTPLREENGLETARFAARTTRSCVMAAINKSRITDEIVDGCTACGMLVIAKPIDRHLFHHYLMFTDCLRSKMMLMAKENDELKNTVEEIKIIDRAKCLLIETLFMTEAQAHCYLEKQAMNMRVTKSEIAKQVIKTYGG